MSCLSFFPYTKDSLLFFVSVDEATKQRTEVGEITVVTYVIGA